MKNVCYSILLVAGINQAQTQVSGTAGTIQNPVTTTQYIRETREDINEALVNIPERVPTGPQVRTLAGAQLTIGTHPQDFKINQEIYNDIHSFQTHMQGIMELVLQLGKKPSLVKEVEILMQNFSQMLIQAGIRYNKLADFTEINKEFNQIRIEITQVSRQADFMLFKPRFEKIIAEITNALTALMTR